MVLRRFRERLEESRISFDSARYYIGLFHEQDPQKRSSARPPLGLVLAGLGLHEEAIYTAIDEVSAVSSPLDALEWAERMEYLSITYVMAGKLDEAIDVLDTLLSQPSWVTVPMLRYHPSYDPLRDHPRFQVLLQKYGGDQAGI